MEFKSYSISFIRILKHLPFLTFFIAMLILTEVSVIEKNETLFFMLIMPLIWAIIIVPMSYILVQYLKEDWNKNLTGYLEKRPCLQIFVHLIDARHKDLVIDKNVDAFLKSIKRGDQIIINAFTKTDKLKQNDLAKLKRENPDGIFVSNLKKRGLDQLRDKITEHLFGN